MFKLPQISDEAEVVALHLHRLVDDVRLGPVQGLRGVQQGLGEALGRALQDVCRRPHVDRDVGDDVDHQHHDGGGDEELASLFGADRGQDHGQDAAERVAQERHQEHGRAVDAGGPDRGPPVVLQGLGQPVMKEAPGGDGQGETEEEEGEDVSAARGGGRVNVPQINQTRLQGLCGRPWSRPAG